MTHFLVIYIKVVPSSSVVSGLCIQVNICRELFFERCKYVATDVRAG